MQVNDLVKKFKDDNYEDIAFIIMLNEIANYVMYEQAIIKKDNQINTSTIKYRFDEKSYKHISSFFSKIQFLSKPVIGSGKKVIIKNLPKEYKYESKHTLSLNDKIYLLDKIKDSFMHLNANNTLFDFDFNQKVVIIKNKGLTYSLECKIPFQALYMFNKQIKENYDTSRPSLDWIDNFFNRENRSIQSYRVKTNEKSVNIYEIRVSFERRVFYIPDTDYYYFFEKNSTRKPDEENGLTKKEYDFYHINSYISLLKSSSDEMNYPLLESIYDFDFHCEHPAYVSKMSSIMSKMLNFYTYIYNNIDYLNYELLKKKIVEFIYYTSQNGNKSGLLIDICEINNMIIKKYMRNARSHANNRGIPNSSIGNEAIMYYDVSYNSLQTETSLKTKPTFVLFGRRKKLNKFFNEIVDYNLSTQELYNQILNNLCLGKADSLELFLNQLSKLINQASKDNIEYAESLKDPVGNATDFVDFIRKILNGCFEYEDSKGNVKIIK